MLPYKPSHAGFTLIEILIAVAIVAILASVVAFSVGGSSAPSRDAKRQADLRNLQTAIELYKARWGRYPEGCRSNGTQWSGQPDTAFSCPSNNPNYIVGASGRPFSDFMSKLPVDPRLPPDLNGTILSGKAGYAYITNAEGSVYKLMAMNTVESERVDYNHPFKSCDIIPDPNTGSIQNLTDGGVNGTTASTTGWCQRGFGTAVNGLAVQDSFAAAPGNLVAINKCRMSVDMLQSAMVTYGGNDPDFPSNMNRFERSYGVWGGFAQNLENGSVTWRNIRPTSAVICK